jgi:Protein of unknown function (DUF4239)
MLIQLLSLLDALPLWGLFLATFVVVLFSFEGGLWVGRRSSPVPEQQQEKVVSRLVAGILGLMAFMVAFTFGVAASHFDSRRQALLDEVNAIRTAYLRADLLQDPHRSEIRKLLREYVDVRLEGRRPGKIEEAITRSEELQDQLWSQAVAARENTQNSAFIGNITQSLNEVITLHSRRVTAGLRIRIPDIIWLVIYALTMLAAASIGYHAGLTRSPRIPVIPALILAYSAIILLIADLDRPLSGFLEVDQQAMIDLRNKMNSQTR